MFGVFSLADTSRGLEKAQYEAVLYRMINILR